MENLTEYLLKKIEQASVDEVFKYKSLTTPYPEANISTHLFPHINQPLLDSKEQAIINVVGYDGVYFSKKEENLWISGLPKWCERGHGLNYIFVGDVRTEAREFLCDLVQKYGDKCSINASQVTQSCFTKFDWVRKWKTYHFVAIENIHHLWVERNHPVGSVIAYNCEYYPPESNEVDGSLYRFFLDKFYEILYSGHIKKLI